MTNTEISWKAEGRNGVVAAGAAEAVAAGVALLEKGGNAMDATVATVLALNVTDHYECSFGGEVPILAYDVARGRAEALSGQGRAPLSDEAVAWYMEHGIPGDGDIKTAPVPSVLDSCTSALQRYGTASLSDVVAPALDLLDAGNEAWHPRLAATLRKLVAAERAAAGSREEKLQAASDHFYGRPGAPSDIAESMERFYREKGGFLRRRDLAAHATTVETPVRVSYRGYEVCKCGPWTQGPMLCQALRLLEGFDLEAMGYLSADFVHVVTEALKLAMADRDAHYGDPDFVEVPLTQLLSDAYTELRRPLIDRELASLEVRPGDPRRMLALREGGVYRPGGGGTTTCVVADRWGNVVSATPSANVHRPTVDGGMAGVTFGNRLRSLNTTPGHPNCIAPGKRPRSTLTPTLVMKGGQPALAISVAGGDLQDQTTLNLLLYAIDFGMAPEEAVTAPRFVTAHHEDSFNPHPDRPSTFVEAGLLRVHEVLPETVRRELERRGHRVQAATTGLAAPSMLQLDPAGGLARAAGDPSTGRHSGTC